MAKQLTFTNPEDCVFGDERLFPEPVVYLVTQSDYDLLKCKWFPGVNVLLCNIVDENDDSGYYAYRVADEDEVVAFREKMWPGYAADYAAERSQEANDETTNLEDM